MKPLLILGVIVALIASMAGINRMHTADCDILQQYSPGEGISPVLYYSKGPCKTINDKGVGN